jgi:beta-lactamase class A
LRRRASSCEDIDVFGVAAIGPQAALLCALALSAGPRKSPPQNAPPSSCQAPHLLAAKNNVLQADLQRGLREEGFGDYIEKRLLAVAVVDLTNADFPAYAGVNDDVMLYAASLPKIAILLAVIERVASGALPWDGIVSHRLGKMITVSDNVWATWGFELAGINGIAETLQRPDYCLYDPPFGGLWVGRAFAKSRQTRLDPLFDITHGATARQAARFYALLDEGQLVSHYWSARMNALMAPPEHHHKLVAALQGRPGVVFLARKSGTWREYHSDGALIQHFHHRYIVVVLTELWEGEGVVREVGKIVDDLIVGGEHRRRDYRRDPR